MGGRLRKKKGFQSFFFSDQTVGVWGGGTEEWIGKKVLHTIRMETRVIGTIGCGIVAEDCDGLAIRW